METEKLLLTDEEIRYQYVTGWLPYNAEAMTSDELVVVRGRAISRATITKVLNSPSGLPNLSVANLLELVKDGRIRVYRQPGCKQYQRRVQE